MSPNKINVYGEILNLINLIQFSDNGSPYSKEAGSLFTALQNNKTITTANIKINVPIENSSSPSETCIPAGCNAKYCAL